MRDSGMLVQHPPRKKAVRPIYTYRGRIPRLNAYFPVQLAETETSMARKVCWTEFTKQNGYRPPAQLLTVSFPGATQHGT